jgi:hypothetical protein
LSSAACGVVDVAAQTQTGTFERTLQVNGPVNLSVTTGSGDIQIRTGSGETVHVIGRIRAGGGVLALDDPAARISQIEKNPPIEQTGATVRVGATGDNPLYRNISISYEITVPANAEIRSVTGSGSQSIGSVRGSVTAQSGSGSINIAEAGGDVRARTGSGSIRIERAARPGRRVDGQRQHSRGLDPGRDQSADRQRRRRHDAGRERGRRCADRFGKCPARPRPITPDSISRLAPDRARLR